MGQVIQLIRNFSKETSCVNLHKNLIEIFKNEKMQTAQIKLQLRFPKKLKEKVKIMKKIKPSDIGILPRNFGELLNCFYDSNFETEVKFGRFKVDFYSENMKLAF